MPTEDDLRAAGKEIQGQLWPMTRNAATPKFPAARLAPDFFDYVQQTAFGMIWTRPGLPKRDRSLITCTMLAALMQVAVYAGVPAAVSALRVAADVLGTPA
jgi:alkylhydroperoxidase/carboxymuconolactone decarboxylase family protein YurZ